MSKKAVYGQNRYNFMSVFFIRLEKRACNKKLWADSIFSCLRRKVLSQWEIGNFYTKTGVFREKSRMLTFGVTFIHFDEFMEKSSDNHKSYERSFTFGLLSRKGRSELKRYNSPPIFCICRKMRVHNQKPLTFNCGEAFMEKSALFHNRYDSADYFHVCGEKT